MTTGIKTPIYEFRLYKNIKRTFLKPSEQKDGKDYIILLYVEVSPDDTIDLVGFSWFTTKKVAGKASLEYILKHDCGWTDTDFDFVLKYRSSVYEEVKKLKTLEEFQKYIKTFANEFRWVEV